LQAILKLANLQFVLKFWRTIVIPLVLIVSAISPALSISSSNLVHALAPVTYYLDCTGNDQNAGTSVTLPWKTLSKANTAKLLPGDKLLLKRGCTFIGTLNAYWNGTASMMIVIGAYGTGTLPKIQNGANDLGDKYYNAVDVQGSYLSIENLEVTTVNPPVEPGCQNNPIGFFVGFNFRNPKKVVNGGSYNLLRLSKATRFTAGVHTTTESHHNRILQNTFSENYVMSVLTPISVGATDDIGAWGVLLRGNKHEVGYNYFTNNNSWCTYDTHPQGNSLELYEATNNSIHHNTSINDRNFAELGGSATIKSDNNYFVYNLVFSNRKDGYFIIVRGHGNQFGPTYRTYLYHNTVYYSGPDSQGIICHSGCGPDLLIAKNNIIWSEFKTVYADAPFVESNNIYWNTIGKPMQQISGFKISSSSKIANPQFMDAINKNLHLRSTSPAINAGAPFTWKKDLEGNPTPQGTAYDIGAYETEPTALTNEVFLPVTTSKIGR